MTHTTPSRSYKDLIVWQKSYSLTLRVYSITKKFPKEELFGLVSQLRRASVSIPSNLAEGNTRISKKDHLHFIRIAYGSGAELETQLSLSRDLGYIDEKEYTESNELLSEVMRMLNTLIVRFSKI